MIETIPLSKLTKSYIDNHDVMCNGVHCKYQETINRMYGGEKKEYIVLNSMLDVRFTKLSELKDWIRKNGEPRNIVSKDGLPLDYNCTINGLRVYTRDTANHTLIYVEGEKYQQCEDEEDTEACIASMKDIGIELAIPQTKKQKEDYKKQQEKLNATPKTENKKPRTKEIDVQINKGRQDVYYTRIEQCGDKRLKYSIRSDSYDFQSYARVMLWNGEKWHQISSIHHKEMKTPHKLAYSSMGEQSYNFASDVGRLRRTAHAIIF